MKKQAFIFIYILAISLSSAQTETVSTQEQKVPFQLSFITPMGTNGMESHKKVNQFSINILAGYAKGLEGLEVGGFANILGSNMTGLQAAGFLNANMGSARGAQFAGFTNFCLGDFKTGIQGSGFANVVASDAQIFQASGFANVIIGNNNGIQASGFTNFANGFNGAQFTGFANLNISSAVGAQIAGFTNLNHGSITGIQIAGFANINSGDVVGSQISGFFNYAPKVTGVQIGFINYANEIEDGIPIGFLSVVKNGYRAFEVGGNESFYSSFSFKTGHRRFYNIFSLAGTVKNDQILWGWGYGVGTSFILAPKFGLQAEVVSYHVNEDEWFTDKLNMLNKVNLTFSYQVSPHLSVYAGPTFNIIVTDKKGYEIQSSELPPIAAGSVFDKTYDRERVILYPGFTLGLRL